MLASGLARPRGAHPLASRSRRRPRNDRRRDGAPLAVVVPLGYGICPQSVPMSDEELRAELERLRSENAALKKTSSKGISMKVRKKGGLSIYGLGRFPITLYKEPWNKM